MTSSFLIQVRSSARCLRIRETESTRCKGVLRQSVVVPEAVCTPCFIFCGAPITNRMHFIVFVAFFFSLAQAGVCALFTSLARHVGLNRHWFARVRPVIACTIKKSLG